MLVIDTETVLNITITGTCFNKFWINVQPFFSLLKLLGCVSFVLFVYTFEVVFVVRDHFSAPFVCHASSRETGGRKTIACCTRCKGTHVLCCLTLHSDYFPASKSESHASEASIAHTVATYHNPYTALSLTLTPNPTLTVIYLTDQ